MIYRLLADLTVVAHFAYVMFVILGLLAILLGWVLKWDWVRNRWFRGIHLLMILIVVLESWAGMICPLTTWERQLRMKAGQATYEGDFIATWVHNVLFIQAAPWVFTLCYTAFGLLVLASLYFVPPKWRTAPTTEHTAR